MARSGAEPYLDGKQIVPAFKRGITLIKWTFPARERTDSSFGNFDPQNTQKDKKPAQLPIEKAGTSVCKMGRKFWGQMHSTYAIKVTVSVLYWYLGEPGVPPLCLWGVAK